MISVVGMAGGCRSPPSACFPSFPRISGPSTSTRVSKLNPSKFFVRRTAVAYQTRTFVKHVGMICYEDENGEIVCDEGPHLDRNYKNATTAGHLRREGEAVDLVQLLNGPNWDGMGEGGEESYVNGFQLTLLKRSSTREEEAPAEELEQKDDSAGGETPKVAADIEMWWRSASFILDKQQNCDSSNPDTLSLSPPHPMPDPFLNPNSNISAYYQNRAAHTAVVTSDWLAQAQAAVSPYSQDHASSDSLVTPPSSGSTFSVIDEFNNWRKQPDLAEAVAAFRALAAVIRTSDATTMMELEIELKKASDSLKSWDTTSISLTAGCDLFIRYVTRTSALEYEDFNSAKSHLIERAEKFGEISCEARRTIAMLSQDFIFDGCTILVHGFSRVVLEVLKMAAMKKKLFRVFCTEGRPDRSGLRLANELVKLDIPVKLLIDSAVAYSMDEVDMVLVGADGVVESGGIINMMGTYQIALVAHGMSKPVYVAAESYKFARLYPLDQKDMAPALRPIDFGVPIPSKVEVEKSARDYTPHQYLTLLFTDLGVLTPSVVSDELIQLYL